MRMHYFLAWGSSAEVKKLFLFFPDGVLDVEKLRPLAKRLPDVQFENWQALNCTSCGHLAQFLRKSRSKAVFLARYYSNGYDATVFEAMRKSAGEDFPAVDFLTLFPLEWLGEKCLHIMDGSPPYGTFNDEDFSQWLTSGLIRFPDELFANRRALSSLCF